MRGCAMRPGVKWRPGGSTFRLMLIEGMVGSAFVAKTKFDHARAVGVTFYGCNSAVSSSSFAVNLSIADTMVSSLNVTFNFVYMLTGHWPFGNVYCKICSFISILSVCGSVFTLIAISIDRYVVDRPIS